MKYDQATWYAYPDYKPPWGELVLIRKTKRSLYYYNVARFIEDDRGNGKFVDPHFAEKFPQHYPEAWMLVPFTDAMQRKV